MVIWVEGMMARRYRLEFTGQCSFHFPLFSSSTAVIIGLNSELVRVSEWVGAGGRKYLRIRGCDESLCHSGRNTISCRIKQYLRPLLDSHHNEYINFLHLPTTIISQHNLQQFIPSINTSSSSFIS